MYITETSQVRATLEELLEIQFQHFVSHLDSEVFDPSKECGRQAQISGFTEWVGQTSIPVSIGWDWYLNATSGLVSLHRIDHPRTNIQIRKTDGRLFSWEQNLKLLGTIADALPWKVLVAALLSAGDT